MMLQYRLAISVCLVSLGGIACARDDAPVDNPDKYAVTRAVGQFERVIPGLRLGYSHFQVILTQYSGAHPQDASPVDKAGHYVCLASTNSSSPSVLLGSDSFTGTDVISTMAIGFLSTFVEPDSCRTLSSSVLGSVKTVELPFGTHLGMTALEVRRRLPEFSVEPVADLGRQPWCRIVPLAEIVREYRWSNRFLEGTPENGWSIFECSYSELERRGTTDGYHSTIIYFGLRGGQLEIVSLKVGWAT